MIYLVIVGIVLLALAPLWHFVPTRRQRQQASLRETAALNGLFVEFRDLPLPSAQRERLPAADRQLLYYGCRLPNLRGPEIRAVSWYRSGEAWMSQSTRQDAPEVARRMPQSVLALGLSQSSCGLFWREQGDAGQVEELAAMLRLWRDELVDSHAP